MAKKLAVAVIHGMGSVQDIHGMGKQTVNFADKMIEEVEGLVEKEGKNPNEIAWQPIYWAEVTDPAQLLYFDKADRESDLDFKKLRRFVVTYLGDVSAYQLVKSQANTTYQEVHDKVGNEIAKLKPLLDNADSTPLIVIAHSLGAHIMSNYIWDRQREDTNGAPKYPNDFEQMRTLAGVVTFGCNIPLFTFAYSNVEPIDLPGSKLSDDNIGKAKWLNFYDPDDVLGYPLRPIDGYKNKLGGKLEDRSINAGGWFASWNPLSHAMYWKDDDFTEPVAKFIADFL